MKRYKKCFKDSKDHSAQVVAKNMYTMLLSHVDNENLYRILYYDCPPLTKKAHNPITGNSVDFSKSNVAIFRNEFLEELKKLRKVAIRLGHLSDKKGWIIRPSITKELLKKTIGINDLKEDDAVDRDHGVVAGDDFLAVHVEHLLHHVDLLSDAVDHGHDEVEPGRERLGEAPEALDRILRSLRHGLDAGEDQHQRQDDDDDYKYPTTGQYFGHVCFPSLVRPWDGM